MTALAAVPTTPRRRSRLAPHGLTWSVLRLHRTALYVCGAAFVAFAATMIWMYAIGDDARASIGACGSPGSGLPSCLEITELTAENDTYRYVLSLATTVLAYAMFPVAAWAGGALIGRELESGTARLAWTQSVTPLRWLAAKLAVPALLLTAGTTAAVLLNVWARQDDNPNLVGDWYYPDVFVTTGPTAVTYVLAGLALGALAGLVTRRALPAAGVGFAATLVLYNILERYREDLWPTVYRQGDSPGGLPRSALPVDNGMVLTSGERVTGSRCPMLPDSACVKDADVAGYYSTFHPRSHFWPLQLVDAGIALAVAALATAAAFWLLRRRTP
ncbi:hypothetical protein FE633_40420 [Streptomyces montanus]|uniref:ABC transporter permease n=1 Tax=Streptomyces montanus TaxID=2580423 RepID=A0A5R9FER3_9ACTN|nr:hypothetical protein [Streptomyces montanus]TLS40686.1 hypothetical protein FE633_40420 [Streptomyces montanus]